MTVQTGTAEGIRRRQNGAGVEITEWERFVARDACIFGAALVKKGTKCCSVGLQCKSLEPADECALFLFHL